MKDTLIKVIIGGATLVGLGTAPVIPQDMELLYSFQCPCIDEGTEGNRPHDYVEPLVISKGNDSYSVFQDRKGNQVVVPIETAKYKKMGEVVGVAENPTKNEFLTAFEAFTEPKPAEAAVAFDSGLYAQAAAASSLTFSFTNTAGNVLYVFGHDAPSVPTVVTGVTYAASAMTKILELNGVATLNDRAITAWRKNSPATGANNVVVTASSGNNLRFSAVSYSGADTTTSERGTDTSTGNAVATISSDITPTGSATGCWMGEFGKDQNGRTYTNTTGDTIRYNTDAGGHHYTDTNSTISGANTITHTMTSTSLGVLSWTICPTQSAPSIIRESSWDDD